MKKIDEQDLSRIIEMAWEDRTPFEAIEREYGLSESEVIRLMRYNLKTNSFKLWRKRMQGVKLNINNYVHQPLNELTALVSINMLNIIIYNQLKYI